MPKAGDSLQPASAQALEVGVGTPEFASQLLSDLYVSLRRNLLRWASVTRQTPQPRMGYVGQHLVSVVTGYPGGRSGARGDDLKLPNGEVAEIKCCYRVDQLGKCKDCGAAVASIEKVCPNQSCASHDLKRNDDSKWLITPKSEAELRDLFVPAKYYFVLFEFANIQIADKIDVRIFEVDPQSPGFALCMIDYYFNIRAHSASKAPFNLWPAMLKFCLMKPKTIYWAVIEADDTISTMRFPGTDEPLLYKVGSLQDYARSDTLTEDAIDSLAKQKHVRFPARSGFREKLDLLQARRAEDEWSEEELADALARAIYSPKLRKLRAWTDEFAPAP
jgi:hypothetical protein